MKHWVLIFTASFLCCHANAQSIECLGGVSGNLLDKFTGTYEGDNQFRYSAARLPAPARGVVRGEFARDGKTYLFNISIRSDVFVLEVSTDNGFEIYSGGLCGRGITSETGKPKAIWFMLTSHKNEDINTVAQDTINIITSPDMKEMRAIRFWHQLAHHDTNVMEVSPFSEFILKRSP